MKIYKLCYNNTPIYTIMDFVDSKSNYTCTLCLKEFKRESSLKKHYAICDVVCQTKAERKRTMQQDDENIAREISFDDLVAIVQNLVQKNAQLEKKVAGLEKWVNTKKKRIVIEEWLDKNVKSVIVWSKFIATHIRATEDQWNDFVSGDIKMVEMIQSILKVCFMNSDDSTRPIQAFNHKTNEIYVYSINKEKESGFGWQKMTPDEFCRVLMYIQKKIMERFVQWHAENASCPSKQMAKINSGLSDIPTDTESSAFPRLLSTVYNCVKREFKTVVEFDI